jgi:hypothetical protein
MNVLKEFYDHVRSTLVWAVVYLVAQTLIWVTLGILVLIYPEALAVLFGIFFLILAAVTCYVAIVVGGYLRKLKKIKNLIVNGL